MQHGGYVCSTLTECCMHERTETRESLENAFHSFSLSRGLGYFGGTIEFLDRLLILYALRYICSLVCLLRLSVSSFRLDYTSRWLSSGSTGENGKRNSRKKLLKKAPPEKIAPWKKASKKQLLGKENSEKISESSREKALLKKLPSKSL